MAHDLGQPCAIRVIKIPAKIDLDKGTAPGSVPKGEIEFEDVWFTYPKNTEPTLKGVSFKVHAGEFCGLTGETSSRRLCHSTLSLKFIP